MRILGKDFLGNKTALGPLQMALVCFYARGGFQKIVDECSSYRVGLIIAMFSQTPAFDYKRSML